MAEQFLFMVGIYVATILGGDALITRCTEPKTDSVSFVCPPRTVIYQPSIYMGISNTSTCNFKPGDCTGWSPELLRQRRKCVWQRRCNMQWKTRPFVTSSPHCVGQIPTYVAYDRPKCVAKGKIYSICSFTDDVTKASKGVIRSHDIYPESYLLLKGKRCSMVLKPKSQHELRLHLDEVNLDTQDHISVLHRKGNKTIRLSQVHYIKDKIFFVDEGQVEIVFFVSLHGPSNGKGFIIRFENVKKRAQLPCTGDYVLSKRRSSRNIVPKSEATVYESIPKKKTYVTISCPRDHVIHNLDVKAVKSSKKNGQLFNRNGDCEGKYYTLVTEVNKCSWKNECKLTKRPYLPLTSTNSLDCLAKIPNFLATRNYQCLPKANVIDICNKAVKYINAAYGLIKSHENYPWHYPTKRDICRKRIRVNEKDGLRMYTEAMDLDPATRGDNLKIFLLKDGRKLIKKLVANQKVDVQFTSGIVIIQFRVSKQTQGGKGFILKFETIAGNHVESNYKGVVNAVAFKPYQKMGNIRASIFYARNQENLPELLPCQKISRRLSRQRLTNDYRYSKRYIKSTRRTRKVNKFGKQDLASFEWAASSVW